MLIKKNHMLGLIVAIVIIFLASIKKVTLLATDYLWFKSLGFSNIFTISLRSKLMLFIVSTIIFLIILLINLAISSKLNKSKLKFKIKAKIALVISIFAGLLTYPYWFNILSYINQAKFNLIDPIFSKDVSFYIFSLPFILFLIKFALAAIIITTVLVLLDYLQSRIFEFFKGQTLIRPQETINKKTPEIKPSKTFPKPTRPVLVHLAILGSLIFILISIKNYIARFSIMYSQSGIVVGAGYTDVVAFLPIIKFLLVLSIIITVLFYVWIFFISTHKKLLKKHILIYAIAIYFITFILVPTVVPSIIQTLKVSPNEINLETPYIENNIKFTKFAYGLTDVEEQEFSAEGTLTREIINKEHETLSNVRILDWRPLIQTYKQTQEIRLYYDLSSIDIDRYLIDGKYTSVMLAPRELNQRKIIENAQTWVNLHMVYTHGFGLVVSPVSEVTKQGLPNYFVKNIPPELTIEDEILHLDEPRVYYGEQYSSFVLVNTKTKEFDYPKGDSNQYTHYTGKGGVNLNSFFKKLLMAIRFSDIKILLSSDMTKESKILFTRNIQNRINTLTPFISLDNDPYPVISNKKLYWIQDGYTLSDKFPYSEKIEGINYIRNSVKIIIDAYDGSVTYYVSDDSDPLIKTYSNIFPGTFKPIESMPEDLRDHTRYPEDLFKIQSLIYSIYHMNDPIVFYNKEDAWQIPFEVYGTGQKTIVEPYYIIIKLPGEEKEEFVLMTSFTPIKKDNMVSWLAARSDKENYGKLLLYKFPKEKLIYGPLQIEAKFDQDSLISQQITLWSQQGSRVTRGNLLVIPLQNSILYIEPLYIQAETGQLPELKRILVSDGERVVMEETLDIALSKLFGEVTLSQRTGEKAASKEELIDQAKKYYDNLLDSMGNDWVRFGENFDNLGQILNELSIS